MESAENENLHQREISYLRDVLCDFRLNEEDHTVFGFCESGDEEKILETLAAITSTCFINTGGHFRDKGHRRFNEGCFILIYPFLFQFTRCLAEGVPLNSAFNMHIERTRIACSLLGNCYSDMSQWVSILQHCVLSRVVDSCYCSIYKYMRKIRDSETEKVTEIRGFETWQKYDEISRTNSLLPRLLFF